MAGDSDPNPWIAAGEAARDRAARTQDQGVITQDQGVETQDQGVATQDEADRAASDVHPVTARRKAKGLSIAALSRQTGVPASSISRLESGRSSSVSPQNAHAISTALDGNVVDLHLVSAEASPTMIRRYELGMTREDLAETSGLSVATIANIEAGGVPLAATVSSLSQALDSSPEELFPDLSPEQVEAADHTPSKASSVDPDRVVQATPEWLEANGVTLGAYLLGRRNEIGATQEDVASTAGISAVALSQLERDLRANPRASTIIKVEAALDSLMAERGPAPTPPAHPLRESMEAAGLSANALAAHSGVAASTIGRILDGTSTPTEATLAAIRDGFVRAGFSQVELEDMPAGRSKAPAAADRASPADRIPEDQLDPASRELLSALLDGPASEPEEPAAPPEIDVGPHPEVPVTAAPEGNPVMIAGPLAVEVPHAPVGMEPRNAPALPPHLAGRGPQAAYFDATMRGYAAGQRAGQAAASAAGLPVVRGEGEPAQPIVRVDEAGQRLEEARQFAHDNRTGLDEDVGTSWDTGDAAYQPPVGTAESAREADSLRESTFGSADPGSEQPMGSPAVVHSQRFAQSARDGFQSGWTQVMTERALLAAQDHPELMAPDVTPEMHAQALAAIGRAPRGGPQANDAGAVAGRGAGAATEADAGPAAVVRPEAASGVRDVDDPAPDPAAPEAETPGTAEPTPEPEPSAGDPASVPTAAPLGRAEPAPQLPGRTQSVRSDPATLGLTAAETRSSTAPEQSVSESQPAPNPAPEVAPAPELEMEQSKET